MMLLPSTFPASSARAGIAAIRISTTRVDFSSTTLCAIDCPNVTAEAKNTTPNASATMYTRPSGSASGSSSSTFGETLSACTTPVGVESRPTTEKPSGSSDGTMAASTSPLRTRRSAAAVVAVGVTSRPADDGRLTPSATATGVLSSDVALPTTPAITMDATTMTTRMSAETMNALLRRSAWISRALTSRTADTNEPFTG